MKKNLNLFRALSFATLLFSSSGLCAEFEFETDPSIPIVYFNAVFRTGSVDDPAQFSGLTNFTAEMMLRGTAVRTKSQLDLELDRMGARLDVETRAEATIFRGAVLQSELPAYLALVKEVLTRPSFAEVEIRKLKSEVKSGLLEELSNDGALTRKRWNQFLFGKHPYGNDVTGTIRGINSLTAEVVRAHAARKFRSNRLILVASGPESSKETLNQWLKQVDGELVGGDPRTPLSPPKNSPSRSLLVLDKPQRTQTQIAIGQVGVRVTDQNWFALYIANHVFGGGSFSSTLMREIREKRGWSYGAYSNFRQGTQPRAWSISLYPASKDTAAALQKTLELVQELRENGITQAQFDFAKASLLNSSGFMYNTPDKRVENTILEKMLDLPRGTFRNYGEGIQKVTHDQVNAALKEFLRPDQLAITVLATAKDLKAALQVSAQVPADRVRVIPYDQEVISPKN
jgi:zinc protease